MSFIPWAARRESLLFVQVPEAQSALVSVDPRDGAIVALVGGFDFFQSKYNRVTQARRQPGFGIQALRLCGRLRQGIHAGERGAWMRRWSSTTAGKEQAWRPKENGKQVLRPDPAARGTGSFAKIWCRCA